MDKKKIEIGVIVLCIVVTGGVLWYGFGGGGGNATPPPAVDNPATGLQPIGEVPSSSGSGDVSSIPTVENGTGQPAPAVFPSDITMDTGIYASTRFRNLQDYTPLTVSPEEIGRPNPFAPLGQ